MFLLDYITSSFWNSSKNTFWHFIFTENPFEIRSKISSRVSSGVLARVSSRTIAGVFSVGVSSGANLWICSWIPLKVSDILYKQSSLKFHQDLLLGFLQKYFLGILNVGLLFGTHQRVVSWDSCGNLPGDSGDIPRQNSWIFKTNLFEWIHD